MADLFYPQLLSGTFAQYPIRKSFLTRTISNSMLDGRIISAPDTGATRLLWDLSYVELAPEDCEILRRFYELCSGGLRPFTFIDPVDNMLGSSSDFDASDWQIPDSIKIEPAGLSQNGKYLSYTFTNNAQDTLDVSQLLSVPAGCQYCFSLGVEKSNSNRITLVRRGQNTQEVETFPVGPSWTRVASSGRLIDESLTYAAALRLNAGQQVTVYGAQLEPQAAPSRYRPTGRGGIYTNAHFASQSMYISADGPDSYSVRVAIEAKP